MAELRAACEALGWQDVATYIQSGNVVFTADAAPAELEATLEKALAARFGIEVPAIVRTAASWSALVAANPFPAEAEREPNRVQLLVSKAPPAEDAADRLAARAAGGERVRAAGGALWLYYPAGIAGSKLTPALVDKAAGSPATGRNWRTVLALGELLG